MIKENILPPIFPRGILIAAFIAGIILSAVKNFMKENDVIRKLQSYEKYKQEVEKRIAELEVKLSTK